MKLQPFLVLELEARAQRALEEARLSLEVHLHHVLVQGLLACVGVAALVTGDSFHGLLGVLESHVMFEALELQNSIANLASD